MIYALIVLLFFIYNFCLFFINNLKILVICLIVNIILFIIKRIKVKEYLSFILKNILFVLFIFFLNILFTDIYSSFLISFKLFLALNMTYFIFKIIDVSNITLAFYYLLFPLKIFKIDTKRISLIISIGIAFIPILSEQAINIKQSLLNKGFKFNLRNVFTRPHIYLLTYLNTLFDILNDLEYALLMKGFK